MQEPCFHALSHFHSSLDVVYIIFKAFLTVIVAHDTDRTPPLGHPAPHLATLLIIIPFLNSTYGQKPFGLGSTNITLSHESKCILAKSSCDLHSDEPGNATQARTAGTIKGRQTREVGMEQSH